MFLSIKCYTHCFARSGNKVSRQLLFMGWGRLRKWSNFSSFQHSSCFLYTSYFWKKTAYKKSHSENRTIILWELFRCFGYCKSQTISSCPYVREICSCMLIGRHKMHPPPPQTKISSQRTTSSRRANQTAHLPPFRSSLFAGCVARCAVG
jgi:hypothetical protein